MIRQYRSRAMASIHETAEGPHAAGVMDKQTMRKFDEACLTPVRPLTAAEIRALREREGASQAVFAWYLTVTTGPCEPVGTRREAPVRNLAKIAVPCGEKRVGHRRLIAESLAF